MTELIWEGKYDDKGRKVAPSRIALPFQTVETVNEGAADRDRMQAHLRRPTCGEGLFSLAVARELERFGATMPTEPAEDHVIRPYAARAGEYRMGSTDVKVHVLAPERTFWEKATLVHAANKPTRAEDRNPCVAALRGCGVSHGS